jgi:glutamine cyclotransferase
VVVLACCIAGYLYVDSNLIGEPAPVAEPPAKKERKLSRFIKPKLVESYPHDHKAFTQGLFVHNGYFYESTGLHKETSIRKVNIKTGKVEKIYTFKDPKYFGEGIDLWNGQIVMLTWQESEIFFFDLETFEIVRTAKLPPTTRNEGWGLCNNGTHFIFSDGSEFLHYWDPATMTETHRLRVRVLSASPLFILPTRHPPRMQVTYHGKPVPKLNELEFVDGMVLANIWYDDHVAVIDPETAEVKKMWNFKRLHTEEKQKSQQTHNKYRIDCLNGIAFDKATSMLYLTGKWWGTMFALKYDPSA